MTSPTIKIDVHLNDPVGNVRLIGAINCTEENCEFSSSGQFPKTLTILPFRSNGIMRPVNYRIESVREVASIPHSKLEAASPAETQRIWKDLEDQARDKLLKKTSPHADVLVNRAAIHHLGEFRLQAWCYRAIVDRQYLLPLYLSGKFIPLP